jgi:hypothetical protein
VRRSKSDSVRPKGGFAPIRGWFFLMLPHPAILFPNWIRVDSSEGRRPEAESKAQPCERGGYFLMRPHTTTYFFSVICAGLRFFLSYVHLLPHNPFLIHPHPAIPSLRFIHVVPSRIFTPISSPDNALTTQRRSFGIIMDEHILRRLNKSV